MPKPSFLRRMSVKIAHDNEVGAQKALLEELFNDFYHSRRSVYAFNFVRGIFFGLGSVLGGTLVIAVIIWILSLLGAAFPPLDGLFDGLSNKIEPPSSQ